MQVIYVNRDSHQPNCLEGILWSVELFESHVDTSRIPSFTHTVVGFSVMQLSLSHPCSCNPSPILLSVTPPPKLIIFPTWTLVAPLLWSVAGFLSRMNNPSVSHLNRKSAIQLWRIHVIQALGSRGKEIRSQSHPLLHETLSQKQSTYEYSSHYISAIIKESW